MTFEEWATEYDLGNEYPTRTGREFDCRAAWDAATKAEREACETGYGGDAALVGRSCATKIRGRSNIQSERGREMNNSKDHKAAAEPPLDCRVRATMSLCCGMVRAGWQPPSVMHDGLCKDRHGGELGPTYYMRDSGMVMDSCGVMLPRSNAQGNKSPLTGD